MTTTTPWLKFFPQDWMGDPSLRACSLAARGLWIEMISLAHQATPYGHVLINSNAPDIAVLSRMVGTSESECETLVSELEMNGVFSRTRKGTIYSRRMVKDAKKSVHARKIGKLGGNPKLSKQRKKSAQDNPLEKPPDKTQKPDTRYQSKCSGTESELFTNSESRSTSSGALSRNLLAENWEKFRSVYPRRGGAAMGWKQAEKYFQQIVKSGVSPESLITSAEKYKTANAKRIAEDATFVQQASTFLGPSKATWREYLTDSAGGNEVSFVNVDADGWEKRCEHWRRTGRWIEKWGPPPGEPNCQVPDDLVSTNVFKLTGSG